MTTETEYGLNSRSWVVRVLLLLSAVRVATAQPIETDTEWEGGAMPRGIAADFSHTYVTERDGKIKKYNHDGALLTEWSIPSTTAGGIDIGLDGFIYVAAVAESRIYKYTSEGELINYILVDGLSGPNDVALDRNGEIYVTAAGFDRVFRLSPSGELLTSWGGTFDQPDYIGDAQGIAVAPSGDIYVADAIDETILRFDSEGQKLGSWVPNGIPSGIAIDRNGNVYVGSSYKRYLKKFDPLGILLAEWADDTRSRFFDPWFVAESGYGDLFVADAGEPDIIRLSDATGKICAPGLLHLCLNLNRFLVEATWTNFDGDNGAAVVPSSSDDSGLFWFFEPGNWEILVKVLDGCRVNGHFWVFAAATTNVAYTLSVTDMSTGLRREYVNPLGVSSAAITDTTAFMSCGEEP